MKINQSKLKVSLFIIGVVLICIGIYYSLPTIISAVGYIINLFLPFILGYFFSRLVNPLADFLQKKLRCPRGISALIVIIFTIGIIGGAITAIVWNLVKEIRNFYEQFPQIYADFKGYWLSFVSKWSILYDNLPHQIQDIISSIGQDFSRQMTQFIDTRSQPVVGYASDFAKAIPSVFIGIIIFILSVYFMVVDHKNVSKAVHKMLGAKMVKRVDAIKKECKKYLSSYIKAQFTIMCITFLVLIIELSLADVGYALLISVSTAFFDALPVFGSGLILWPLAVINFIGGNVKNGVVMIVAYVSVFVTRHLVEPKLVSSKMGMNPLLTLMAMYVGYRIWGVVGIVLGTIILLIIISLYRAGIFDAPIHAIKRCGRFIGSQFKLFKNFITNLMEDENE